MCGITGIVGPGAEDKGLVRSMMSRVAHRGPDDTGLFQDADCALGHTRLAIIDVSGGHEPIFDAEGTRAIIYNGEIYNHVALRKGLEAEGCRFKTRTDAEVPLHLLATEEGRKDPGSVLSRLDGMFSFTIWDSERRELFAARDPHGIKPFFWTRVDDAFLYASEMKALLAHPDVPAVLDADAVREKACFEYVLPGSTYLEGIHELPPGHFLVTDGREVRIQAYYDDPPAALPADPDALAEHLHGLVVEAVRKRLMSEVPLGVVLSGGLDSSYIAAVDRELDPDRKVTTISVAEDERNIDFEKARLVAETLGTDHHEWFFDGEDLERDLTSVIWSNEDIDYTTYFFYPLFRKMKGIATVGLCGQGADEVFGGYDRYKDLISHAALIRARTERAFPDDPTRHDALLSAHYGAGLQENLTWERGPQLNQFQLRLVDRNSMAFGTEIRVPFLDKRLVAVGKALPDDLLLRADDEKIILRKAAERTKLPKEIVGRRKLPAGRRTSPGIMQRFEEEVEKRYPDKRAKAHPYTQAFTKKAELLAVDLLEEIFVHRRGERPTDLHWNDLV
ncbi:MAG: asparagine synthase (glutamine-hydrolyzing) [Euryarchaeota archaeon]|nr:asparagine synthase (glutamine-hydrolyzing) [Euryarchaeota archaeon]